MTCCCITVFGLTKIAIKKISSKNSVQPTNITSISAELTESIRAVNSYRSDEPQNTFELRAVLSHLPIINVAPIHFEEQSFESLEIIGTIQPISLPLEHNEFNNIDVENPESEETPDIPAQLLCFNNQKFNPNLISFAGLTFLFVITFIVGPIFFWHIRFANDLENLILKTHIYFSLPIALPIVYFIRNPKHLKIAMTILHSG